MIHLLAARWISFTLMWIRCELWGAVSLHLINFEASGSCGLWDKQGFFMANHIMNKHIIAYDSELIPPPKKRSFFLRRIFWVLLVLLMNWLLQWIWNFFTVFLNLFLSLCKFNLIIICWYYMLRNTPNNLHRFGIVDPYLLTLNLSNFWLWVEFWICFIWDSWISWNCFSII